MKPLFVLLIVFGITATILKIFYHHWNLDFAGNFAMSIMLFFTAIAHFAFNKGMAMMLPHFVPYKKLIVYITGLIEILRGYWPTDQAVQAYNFFSAGHILYSDPACKYSCGD